MTLGRQDMAETRRVEQIRTGEKQRGQKSILKPGMQMGRQHNLQSNISHM